jgi:hypothetical protein
LIGIGGIEGLYGGRGGETDFPPFLLVGIFLKYFGKKC